MVKVIERTWKRLIGYFLTGVFTILPLAITVAVVAWVAGTINSYVGPDTFIGDRLGEVGARFVSTAEFSYWVGWIIVLALIFLLGMLVELGARQFWHNIFHGILSHIPLAGSVYETARQLVGMLEKKEDDELEGMSVVYCFFGATNASGILALMPSPEVHVVDGREFHLIYIPTSPLPMTGGLMFVPTESVKPTKISVDGLMSIYLSMGVTAPQILAGKTPESLK